jgi:hypothetical protein
MAAQVAGVGHDNGRIIHGARGLQGLVNLGDGGKLLSNGDIYAVNVFAALIDDGIHGDGGLARLTVADDQLALSAPDGDDAVHREKTRHERFVDRLTIDDARGGGFHGTVTLRVERAVVQRHTDGVDHAAEQFVSNGTSTTRPVP